MVESSLHYGAYLAQSGKVKEATNYMKNALSLSEQIPYNKGRLEALLALTEISQPEEALAYSKEHIRLTDSLQKAQRRFQDQSARIRYESDELEAQNTKVTKRLRWYISTTLGVFILGLLGYIIIQRQNSKKEFQFQQSQQKANEEIYALMLGQQAKLEEGKQLEKQRVSEELHDGILGKLFGIRLSLAGLNGQEGEQVVETRKKFIDELKGLGNEIRQISHNLQGTIFKADTLYEDVIKELVQEQCERFGLAYSFNSDASINWDEIPSTHKVHLYRIIQESLQNVNKHAQASAVVVSFTNEYPHYMLTIEDDGVGLGGKKVKRGIGLKNMRSRVGKMNGELTVVGNKNKKGTAVQVQFAS